MMDARFSEPMGMLSRQGRTDRSFTECCQQSMADKAHILHLYLFQSGALCHWWLGSGERNQISRWWWLYQLPIMEAMHLSFLLLWRGGNVRGPLAMLILVTHKAIIEGHSVYGRGSGRVRGSPHTHFSRVWSRAVRGHVKAHKDLSFNWEKSNHKLV